MLGILQQKALVVQRNDELVCQSHGTSITKNDQQPMLVAMCLQLIHSGAFIQQKALAVPRTDESHSMCIM